MAGQLRLALGSDHAGFEQKSAAAAWLGQLGYGVLDMGPLNAERVDYPDFAAAVARQVQGGQADLGILFCGTGIGMAIAANKLSGIRAANCLQVELARLAREHNEANVLTLSARFSTLEQNKAIIQAFLESEPAGGRHAIRVKKISELEREC